jgi:alpha-beta hydrolase superfamily lysophospholipase
MLRIKIPLLLLVVCLSATAQAQAPAPAQKTEPKAETWSDFSPHKSGFVTVNGVRLNYLDWGGSGPTLILLHGFGDNPHLYDDFAPAFTDRFRVIAYARRAEGDSEANSLTTW